MQDEDESVSPTSPTPARMAAATPAPAPAAPAAAGSSASGAAPPTAPASTTGGYDVTEHRLSLAELAAALQTSLDLADPRNSRGLTAAEAARRLAANGPNELTPPKELPEILKFLHHFTNMFMVMLMVAGALSFLAYGLDTEEPLNLYLGIVLFAIVRPSESLRATWGARAGWRGPPRCGAGGERGAARVVGDRAPTRSSAPPAPRG